MIDLKNYNRKSANSLGCKRICTVDLASAYLRKLKKKNKELNAYLEIFDDVLSRSKKCQRKNAKGESVPLGMRVCIKDIILMREKQFCRFKNFGKL